MERKWKLLKQLRGTKMKRDALRSKQRGLRREKQVIVAKHPVIGP